MRSDQAAISVEWVTRMTVMPDSRLRRRKRLKISTLLALSRLPVGSSAISRGTPLESERAMATRC
jgi:hypothetical protein